MLQGIDHVGVIVADLEESKRFFAGLGLELDRELEIPGRLRAAFFRAGTTQIELIDISEPEERARRLGDAASRVEHIAFEVDELDPSVEALRALGIETTLPHPTWLDEAWMVWSTPESSRDIALQFLQRQGVTPPA